MYQIINQIGKKKGNRSVSLYIKKQHSKEKNYNITLGNTSTIEAYKMMLQASKWLETKTNNSEVIKILDSIKTLSNEKTVKELCEELMEELKQ
jgi:hypothetical protein